MLQTDKVHADIIEDKYHNEAIWRDQFTRNVDNLMRQMMFNVFSELLSRLREVCSDPKDMCNGWRRGLRDIKDWTEADINDDIELLRKKSVHFDTYFKQSFNSFVHHSTEHASRLGYHVDIIGAPSVHYFVKAYLDATSQHPTFVEYEKYQSHTARELKIAYREIFEMALNTCSNEHVAIWETLNDKEDAPLSPLPSSDALQQIRQTSDGGSRLRVFHLSTNDCTNDTAGKPDDVEAQSTQSETDTFDDRSFTSMSTTVRLPTMTTPVAAADPAAPTEPAAPTQPTELSGVGHSVGNHDPETVCVQLTT